MYAYNQRGKVMKPGKEERKHLSFMLDAVRVDVLRDAAKQRRITISEMIRRIADKIEAGTLTV